MARSFNQVTLMGNLTRDPELRSTPNGQSVCSFSLALNRSYKNASSGEWVEATDYVDIVAWGPLGERVAQYLSKGRPALVSGRLQSRSWEQEGQKRSKVEVVANDVTFLGSPSGGGGGAPAGGSDAPAASSTKDDTKKASKKAKDDEVVIEDIGDKPINLDDIPF
ncbi:single-stranded DNA-binding protein [Candidatus Saccharibacteria bacterium CG10_big_fil_rev_8_21_14_0_10_47_8]|nr:MAG: single-stranded DNA-binding protein [Candidatus Saccharibacteria bacterium CG10_big_fil_rev_8_21_14_0_10_47_8]